MKNHAKTLKIVAAVIVISLVATKAFMYFGKRYKQHVEEENLAKVAISGWEKQNPSHWNPNNAFLIKSNPESTTAPALYLIVDLLSTDSGSVFSDLESIHQKKNVPYALAFYPLDQHCNSAISFRSDGTSCQFTAAVMCAQMHFSKGLDLTRLLFSENKKILTAPQNAPSILKTQFEKLGLDKNKIQTCMEEILKGTLIKTSADTVREISFTRLPVILYHDKVYNGSLIHNAVSKLIDENP